MSAEQQQTQQTQQTQQQQTKLTDPYDKEPYRNDQPAKVYIRLPLAEKRLIKVIHPEDNVYQYVISNLWYKLCRACEERGITNFNDLEQFVDLVVNSKLTLDPAITPYELRLLNRPSGGTPPQSFTRNDGPGTGSVRHENTSTTQLDTAPKSGNGTTSGRSGPAGGTSEPEKDVEQKSFVGNKLSRPSRKPRS